MVGLARRERDRSGREVASSKWNKRGTMADDTVNRTVVVTNPQGLHARPADVFVKLASRYQAKIEVIKDGERVDGKSILAILTLAAVEGTQLAIEATGPDAEAALDALSELVLRDFDENGSVE
jgi:phosphotransferase system HPr (HPr) family protein